MEYNFDLVIVTILEFFLAIGAIVGGYSLITDPTGISMFTRDLRQYIIVPDFFIPGLILFMVFGMGTILFLIGLWMKYKIGWISALLISVSELIWILLQIILLSSVGFIIWQFIIPIIAIMMIGFLLIKQNRLIYYSNGKLIMSKFNI